jgi:DnaJ-class molecular chaperone
MKYIALRNCQYAGKIYKQDQILNFVGEVKDCPFCEGTGEVKNKVCPKCKGTKRCDPPHHFKPLNPEEAERQAVEKAKKEAETIESIQKEFEEIGAGFDRRWKLPKLKDELTRVKKEKGL